MKTLPVRQCEMTSGHWFDFWAAVRDMAANDPEAFRELDLCAIGEYYMCQQAGLYSDHQLESEVFIQCIDAVNDWIEKRRDAA